MLSQREGLARRVLEKLNVPVDTVRSRVADYLGKAPKLGVVLEIESEDLMRGALDGLWDAQAIVDPKDFPSFGEMMLDQVNPGGKVLNAIGAKIFDLGSEYHKRRHLY